MLYSGSIFNIVRGVFLTPCEYLLDRIYAISRGDNNSALKRAMLHALYSLSFKIITTRVELAYGD